MSQGCCIEPGPGPDELSEFRAKTDRQILGLIHSKLDLGLNFVALAEQTDPDGLSGHAGKLLRRAEQAVTEVKHNYCRCSLKNNTEVSARS
jgi:hypothetical protein